MPQHEVDQWPYSEGSIIHFTGLSELESYRLHRYFSRAKLLVHATLIRSKLSSLSVNNLGTLGVLVEREVEMFEMASKSIDVINVFLRFFIQVTFFYVFNVF